MKRNEIDADAFFTEVIDQATKRATAQHIESRNQFDDFWNQHYGLETCNFEPPGLKRHNNGDDSNSEGTITDRTFANQLWAMIHGDQSSTTSDDVSSTGGHGSTNPTTGTGIAQQPIPIPTNRCTDVRRREAAAQGITMRHHVYNHTSQLPTVNLQDVFDSLNAIDEIPRS